MILENGRYGKLYFEFELRLVGLGYLGLTNAELRSKVDPSDYGFFLKSLFISSSSGLD